jgi:transcriptional regulator with AAA-type ATPase domain
VIQASWLGSWRAPWALDKGRRWGDLAWTLAAISEAWVLGGREGRWPRLDFEARRPHGPRVVRQPERFEPTPDPAFIALLRHGSAAVPAERRGAKEDPLRWWAWEALLAGDGEPWFAAAAVLLDLETRLRWIAVLGAVDEGRILLPPFLDLLLPPALKRPLPEGWAAALLGALDAEGRLLPSGDPPTHLPWDLVKAHGGPLLLRGLPEALRPFENAAWLHRLEEGAWMIDPRLRAWTRGFGLSPQGLEAFRLRGLASGEAAEEPFTTLLAGRTPSQIPEGWTAAVDADLAVSLQRPPVPEACGDPTWDRLRSRWGGALPPKAEGYPEWGQRAHPCADPFHWMQEGRRAHGAGDPEHAHHAFTLAHAHFARLGSTSWAERAATNAEAAATLWADLPAVRVWQARQPEPSDRESLQQRLFMMDAMGDREGALRMARSLARQDPDFEHAWIFIALQGLSYVREDWLREALPHLHHGGMRWMVEQALADSDEGAHEELGAELPLIWETNRLLRGGGDLARFWELWHREPNFLARLELGIHLLRARPGERTPERLLALQAIAERAESPGHRASLEALWPKVELQGGGDARAALEAWLARQAQPTTVQWGPGPRDHRSVGTAPPDGALAHLARAGSLPPVSSGGLVWWGSPLAWEEAPVGSILLGLAPGAPLELPAGAELLAPWLARLHGPERIEEAEDESLLWTDGSEPMAAVMKELRRVAPSELPVLVLGPTGSGKELAARELHRLSGRSGHLVAVNCAAFAEGLLESELFGHVKGAFTGATQDRRGAIETAQNGTLFLDEVADLSPRLQSLLLRVLQEREVRRVGSDRAIRVDLRFVAATHRALDELVEQGAFRRDLLFRLQGSVLRLPPLSHRRHELAFLLPRLVARTAKAMKRDAPDLAPGLAKALARLAWPGNFRELGHALERALLRCEDGVLRASHFPELERPAAQAKTWEEATKEFQRGFLLEALRQHGFKAAEAAHALGLARPALYATAKRLGLDLALARATWEDEAD